MPGERDTVKIGRGESFSINLARLASARRASIARGALSVVLTITLATFSLLLALHRLIPVWHPLPLFSFVVFWVGISAALVFGAVYRVFPLRDESWLVTELDKTMRRGNLFTAALEFLGSATRLRAYSPFLMRETVRRAGKELDDVNARRIFSTVGRPGWTLAGILVGLLVVIQVISPGTDIHRVLAAISDPGVYLRQPRGFNLLVTTGNNRVLAGEDVTVEAVSFGSSRGETVLRVSSIPGIWKRVVLQPVPLTREGVALSVYRHIFSDVRENFTYFFEAGEERTRSRNVTVVHRPVINRLSATLTFPSYTEAVPETISTLAGKLVALKGTLVDLEGETSKGIRDGTLSFRRRADVMLTPVGNGFRCRFTVTADDTFTIAVTDSIGLGNEVAVAYPIVAVDDRPPDIELLAPEDKALLPRSFSIDLIYRMSDDYGLSTAYLHFMREGKEEGFRRVTLTLPQEASVNEVDGLYRWSLAEEGALPGDRILYFLEAFDNNTVTGPGSVRTETRELVVPSLSQIYTRMREEEAIQRGELDVVFDRGREIQERLQKLSDELKAEGKFDWSRRREGGEILKKHEELQEKIRTSADRLDDALRDLERNRMTSQEIGEKMEEIQKLLREIESEDLRRTIEKFRRMLDEVKDRDLITAMGELEMDTEDLVNRLDRTIELLKQVLREEKMEELVRRMEEMLDEQMALRDSTASGDIDELAGHQEQLGDEFGHFKEDLHDFAGEESDSAMASHMEQMLDEMTASQIEEMMRQAAQEILEGDRQQAQCTQGNITNRMLNLYTSLGRCQMAMGMSLQREVIERIERAAHELVEVSHLEEELIPDLRIKRGSDLRDEIITKQLVLKEAVRKITDVMYEMGRKTMAISPQVFLHLGGALAEIEKVLDSIEEGRSAVAARSAGVTCERLNRAVVEILRATSSTGGASGSARERMQMMLQQQLAIDERLRRLLDQGSVEGMSMEDRATMARLAAEQRKLEELLEQIVEESRGAGELLGRLDDITGEMKEIARRLEEGELDRELIQREERILSRMLDSQRSLHRRDYKKERVSTTAGDVRALGPGTLEGELDRREMLLRMIRRGMREKGPAEYEELIRMYFRALSRKVRDEQ